VDKAEKTRQDILKKAFDLIYQHGYQATSVDKIISTTQLTKGAFYYHFKNKDEMGIAMVKELILPMLEENLLQPLEGASDPITRIYKIFEKKLLNDPEISIDLGCPTNNLVQEMSPISVKFHKTLRYVLDKWIKVIREALETGKQERTVNADVDAQAAAEFIVASYEGVKGVGKIYGKDLYVSYLKQFKNYLETLR
jgi:TetR/AcrR family transcriptional repressor of nem operon